MSWSICRKIHFRENVRRELHVHIFIIQDNRKQNFQYILLIHAIK